MGLKDDESPAEILRACKSFNFGGETRLGRNKILPLESKNAIIEAKDIILFHFGLGSFIRNKWQLWQGSRLAKYFTERAIFIDPDTMSSIILTYYKKWLSGDKESWKEWELKNRIR